MGVKNELSFIDESTMGLTSLLFNLQEINSEPKERTTHTKKSVVKPKWLIRNIPNVKWGQVLKGSKKYIHYGKPVLEGFKKRDVFEPIRSMSVVASGFADNTYNSNRLKELYYKRAGEI